MAKEKGLKIIKKVEDGEVKLRKVKDENGTFRLQVKDGSKPYKDIAIDRVEGVIDVELHNKVLIYGLSNKAEAEQGPEEPTGDLALEKQESVRKYSVPKMTCKLVREGTMEAGSERVTSAHDVRDMLMEHMRSLDREHFIVILLNAKGKVIGITTVSIGSLDATVVHPREVLKPAFIGGAAKIIFVHNHPSGDPTPSNNDIEVTKRLKDASDIMGITLNDHVIIGDGCYFSFREKGLI